MLIYISPIASYHCVALIQQRLREHENYSIPHEVDGQSTKIEKQEENIQISLSIGSIIEFLDVIVENNNGQLRTSVFHKPSAKPYILPYLSDHPRHIHRSTIRSRLLREAQLCSHVEEFGKERLSIEFTLLLNGYPSKFISYHLKKNK